MYEYRVVPGEPIPLGRRYENFARRIIFDITEWVETFGSGVVMLLHQRQGDEIPYPVTVLRTNADMETPNHTSGVLVLWDVTNVDTEKKCQYGSAELRYYATGREETLVKSELYRTIVTNAMGSEIADAPEGQQEWLVTLLDAADNISAAQPAAEAALSAVSDAQAAAADAQTAASNAADEANTATAAALAARAAQSEAEAALSHISVTVSGGGNAVTGLSYDAETNEFTAAKAATFLTEHQSLSNYATKAELPTKTSDLTNDSGFLTSHQSLADYATKAELPTKTSDLSNDSGFITNVVNDLTNYYRKSETYTKEEINSLISAVPKLDIQVVSSLPASDISTETIYLVTTGNESQNLYTEYIYANNSWEKLGTQTLDLSGYVQTTRTVAGHALSADVTISKSDVGLGNVDNTSDADKPISAATQSALNGKVDKDGSKVLSDNNYTTSEKNKLAGIPADATNNAGTITGITMNGASKGTSGVVDLGTVLTSHQDISGKVDKVTGKGLSTNDFTDAYKTKLDSALTQHQDISGKVDKVTGKGLSTNDYTTAEKSKLSGIEAQANKTTIDDTLSHTGQAADAKAAGDAVAALRNYIASMEVYRNASGNPATFDDGAASNLKNVTVTITPTQSGSGDPSPTNVRPITGVSSVSVTRTRKNLFDAANANVLNAAFWETEGTDYLLYARSESKTAYIRCLPNTTYTVTHKVYTVSGDVSSDRFGLGYTYDIPEINQRVYGSIGGNGTPSLSITTGQDARYLCVRFRGDAQNQTDTVAEQLAALQIEYGSEATAYEAYQGQTATVALLDSNSDPLTVYGGTLDVTTGTLSVTHGVYTFDGNETWTVPTENTFAWMKNATVASEIALPDTIRTLPDIVCEVAAPQTYLSVYTGSASGIAVTSTYSATINGRFCASMDIYNARAQLTGKKIVYRLATPVTYQLTPQQLAALAGYNAVSTDAGSVSVTYKADTSIVFGGVI